MREKIRQPLREHAGSRVLLRAPASSRPGGYWELAEADEALHDATPRASLAPSIRGGREAGSGLDFGAVRIHSDERAGRAADAVGAQTFTSSTNIHFARSAYAPAPAGVLQRAAAPDVSTLDTLIGQVGTGIDAATAPPTTKKQSQKRLAQATEKAKKEARERAILALATQVRSEVPDRAKLDALLDDKSLSDEAKVAVLGEIAVQVARMEFLLGWMYYGGVPKTVEGKGKKKRREKKNWEEAGKDKGVFPNLYQKEVSTSEDGGSFWCTSFAGYAYKRLGLDSSLFTSKGMVFASGGRLETWATTGQSNGGRQLTPADKTADSLDSAEFIGRGSKDWKQLTKALTDSDTAVTRQVKKEKLKASAPEAAKLKADGREAAVAAFFEEHGEPQPGDIIVLGEKNEYVDTDKRPDKVQLHSHTTMVERYDAATRTITTIEGNATGAVRSQKLVLTNPKDVARIVHLTRPGIEHYQRSTPASASPPPATPAAPATAKVDTRAALASSVEAVIEKLVKLASDREWILSDDADASVFEWLYGPEADDNAGAGMSTQ